MCEPKPYWAPAMQREFHAEAFVVRGCRRPSELDALIVAHRTTIVICDLESGPANVLAWLASRQKAPIPTVISGSSSTAGLEAVCRELGVWSFLPDLIPHNEIAALCRRWLRLLASPS
ncbi:MAG: hypothetical protein Q8K78_08105 [Planctomycetaceae bacterium]|nr:hypothetical protein [Planctomycetaceae bacterium]